jgi:hypothetical protein
MGDNLMEKKLVELQDLAEKKGKEYFFLGKKYDCISSMLMALNDTLKEVDSVDYSDPNVLKAANPLPAGFGALDGPCGVVTAGSLAIGLKFGTSNPTDQDTIERAWMKSREWLFWFKHNFGSYNCIDLTNGADFFKEGVRKEYMTGPKVVLCNTYLTQSIRKLVEILTEGN